MILNGECVRIWKETVEGYFKVLSVGVKRPAREADYSPPSIAEVKE